MKCNNCTHEQEGPAAIRITEGDHTLEFCSQRCAGEYVFVHRKYRPEEPRHSLREFGKGGWQ